MKPADAFLAPSEVLIISPMMSTNAVATLLKSPLFHSVTSQQGGSLWSSQTARPTGFSTSRLGSSGTRGVFDASVGVGDTLGRCGMGFWSGGVVGAAAPLVGAAPLVAVLSVALAAGASGAGATDIGAAASSKVATGGAWSGEWSGDAWTGSSPSDAWLGTGDAAGATGASGSDASFADLCASLQLAVRLAAIYALSKRSLLSLCRSVDCV